ncbi:hypothetical protein P691DRAFT_815341 [Macrolepiota fuliginosa MF-IS2]|uniref:Transmembrane protein n=1 Tax=Macrolepiota fuliginosa MF-IS2 TaxID=1400762 RepID=A0A9P5XCU0_9AGAR|nr:hypothetical protein P691DRAFT_815341 [Macrolepiota fuliginosa MF-IS2]
MDAQPSVPLTVAQLAGDFCEAAFYGIYLATCCVGLPALFLTGNGRGERWLRAQEIHWVMLIVAVALFVICTFDVIIGILHNFQAFLGSKDATGTLSNLEGWINIARSVNQVMAILVSDFVLLYRCWVVCGRQWLAIIPSLVLYIGVISVALMMAIGARASFWGSLWTALFAITAAQNILTTCILIWRIWRVERQSKRYLDRMALYQPRHLRRVIQVIAESGAVYTIMMLSCAILEAWGSYTIYPVSDMALQLAGIMFNAIIFRCSARCSDQQLSDLSHTALESIQFYHERSEQAIALKITTCGPERTKVSDEILL